MNKMANINLLMMDWWRILELRKDDLLKLTLKDRSEITGFIYNLADSEIPVDMPATFKFDVILLRRAIENTTENESQLARDDKWTIIYKNDVESIDIIRAERSIVKRN